MGDGVLSGYYIKGSARVAGPAWDGSHELGPLRARVSELARAAATRSIDNVHREVMLGLEYLAHPLLEDLRIKPRSVRVVLF